MIIEKVNINKKDKDVEIFDYSSIISNSWRNIIKDAQEFQNIYFDLENNDTTGQKRTLYIKKNLRKNQPVKYEINAELCEAGGDWEYPVLYFKIELTRDYSLKNVKYSKSPKYIWDVNSSESLYRNYVLIPPATAGNALRRDGNKFYAHTQDEKNTKEFDITDTKIKMSWKWLIDLISNAVNERHIMLDENLNIKLKSLLEKKNSKIPLTSDEYNKIYAKFGRNPICSFAKDDNGYYCYTHRARSKSKKTIDLITMKEFKFICSTS